MLKTLVVCLVVVIFVIVFFVMVVFVLVVLVIAHCPNTHVIVPHGVTAVEAFISSLAFVQEGSPKD